MAKYMIIYNSDLSAKDAMANSTAEQRHASMAEWIKWREDASKQIKVEFGLPMQAISRITPTGVTKSENPASGHAILEGDQATIIGLLKMHPHLKRPGATIDLLEFVSMPELETT
jgi:hypothetical protein